MSVKTDPNAPITREQYTKLVRYIKKRDKFLEDLIGDAFEKITVEADRLTQNVDEAIHRAGRAERAVRRHVKKEH